MWQSDPRQVAPLLREHTLHDTQSAQRERESGGKRTEGEDTTNNLLFLYKVNRKDAHIYCIYILNYDFNDYERLPGVCIECPVTH